MSDVVLANLINAGLTGVIGIILLYMTNKQKNRDRDADTRDKMIAAEVEKVRLEAQAMKKASEDSARVVKDEVKEVKTTLEKTTAAAAEEARQTKAQLAEVVHTQEEHGALLRRAEAVNNAMNDGVVRGPLATIAELRRDNADRTGDPKDIEKAEAAERALKLHDEKFRAQHDAIGRMSSGSLKTYIAEAEEPPPATAGAIAEASVKLKQVVEAYEGKNPPEPRSPDR